jgi:hypothetical protein
VSAVHGDREAVQSEAPEAAPYRPATAGKLMSRTATWEDGYSAKVTSPSHSLIWRLPGKDVVV